LVSKKTTTMIPQEEIVMGKVNYKFEYNNEIDFPEAIKFDGIDADIAGDKKDGYLVEGEVGGAGLDDNGKLRVFVSSSGRAGRTWKLSAKYNGKELEKYPIEGTIETNGFYTENNRYGVKP